MSNSSNNSNFMSTLSSIAYEQLTGNKPSGVIGLHPSNSNNVGFPVTTGSITPTSNSNGTSHWAAGMASAGDVLGNLGMGSTMDLIDSGRNTTWDIPVPPHGSYGSTVQRDLLTGTKDVLPDNKSRSRTKMNSSSAPQHSCRSSGDRRVPSNTSSTGNTRSRGSTNTNIINNDFTVCLPNTSNISSKLTPSAMKAEGVAGALSCATIFIGDDVIGVPNFLSCSESQDKTHHDCASTLTLSDLSLIAGEHCDPKTTDDKTYREQSKRQDQSLVKLLGSNKPTSSITAPVHDSRASSPSSNSNSLTKRKSRHAEESPDSRDMTNSSPYFHLTRNGLDQLEVLSDSGGSISPDTLTEHAGDVGDGSSDGSQIPDLDVGSMVEIIIREEPRFGVIRWLGKIPGDKKEGRTVAGVELEDGTDGLSDGTFDGRRHFSCPPGKAIFVSLSMCRQDSRFLESLASCNSRASIAFGSEDHGPVTGSVPPPSGSAVLHMVGRNKGIQGHQNSCYLDATLFSMFAFTSVFDSLLFRPATSSDIPEYCDVQRVLREHIVNPLRSRRFVRADRIMRLRTMLDHLSSVRGLTTEEKDPEEFLHSLLAQILKAEPFLQLSSGQEAYHYQLFLDKDDRMALPSVQHLFDQSFLTSDIKLKQVPSILILQMPRFGKDYKMYPRILPSLLLDVTDVIENSPRQCFICGVVAEFECPQCFGQCGTGLESIAFCAKCMNKAHTHKKRDSHTRVRALSVPPEYVMLADHCSSVPRVYMELFAVVCIETSHYVAFTRCGEGPDAPWCFFDSMADRKGEQHGYNIPSVVECGELLEWLGEQGGQPAGGSMLSAVPDDKALPDLTRRLLCDAYMCFYQTNRVAMYR